MLSDNVRAKMQVTRKRRGRGPHILRLRQLLEYFRGRSSTHHLFVASSSFLIRILHSIFCWEGPQNTVRFNVDFEGDPQTIALPIVYFEGDPQNIALLKPYFQTKKHYKNVVNSVLNTEQI